MDGQKSGTLSFLVSFFFALLRSQLVVMEASIFGPLT